jgi:hypothetical protein
VFEKRVLWRVFGFKGVEMAGGWRGLHNEELHNMYASENIIRLMKSRKIRWVGRVERMEGMRNAYKILIGKPEGRRPLGRHRRRWEDNENGS